MTLSIKIKRGSEVRRVELNDTEHSFENLRLKLGNLFQIDANEKYEVRYWDDSDWVTLSSDEEVKEMFNAFSTVSSPLQMKLISKKSWEVPMNQIADQVRPVVNQIAGGVGSVYQKVKPQVETVKREGTKVANRAKPFAQNVIESAAPVVQSVADKVSPVAQNISNKVSPIANNVANQLSSQLAPIGKRIDEEINGNVSLQHVQDLINGIQEKIWELGQGMQNAFTEKSRTESNQQTQTNVETNEASTLTLSENEKEKEVSIEMEEIPEEVKNYVHYAICDSCRVRIVGWRHKCNQCPDYDLCHKCFATASSLHPEHTFCKMGKEVAPLRSAPVSPQENVMTKEKLEESVKTLEDMGFTDKQKVIRAIINNKNDLVKAVMELLDH